MTLPTYDWWFLSDTREMAVKERTGITGSVMTESIVIALLAILMLVVLLYVL